LTYENDLPYAAETVDILDQNIVIPDEDEEVPELVEEAAPFEPQSELATDRCVPFLSSAAVWRDRI
jgi:hypothetical protein